MTDFYGPITHEPRAGDVARYVGMIRELVGKKPKEQALIATTTLFYALGEYAVHAFGHLETLRVMKALREHVEEMSVGKVQPWA